MMERGLVIDTDGQTARVALDRNANCAHCNACCMGKDRAMIAEADNPINAKKGDSVMVEVSDRQAVKAVLLVFGLPIVALFLGALAVSSIAQSIDLSVSGELIGGAVGVTLLVLAFVGIHSYDRHLRKRKCNSLTIARILNTTTMVQ